MVQRNGEDLAGSNGSQQGGLDSLDGGFELAFRLRGHDPLALDLLDKVPWR